MRTPSLASHLNHHHHLPLSESRRKESEIVKVFNHMTLLVKHHAYYPNLCGKCGRYFQRLDVHLHRIHSFSAGSTEYERLIQFAAKTRADGQKELPQSATSENTNLVREKSIPDQYRYMVLTPDKRDEFGALGKEFKYYYEKSEDTIEDFFKWLVQTCSKSKEISQPIVKNVETIWKTLDKSMSLAPNALADTELLEDRYFVPHLKKLKVASILSFRSKEWFLFHVTQA